jgi:4-amino-4-deoxy-L-arabinose transferase-like glycosyltransferase
LAGVSREGLFQPGSGRAAPACGAPALIAAAILFYATVVAVGVTPDSVVYLDAAAHLARGEGYTAFKIGAPDLSPVLHYPPLYPWALSLGFGLGLAPLEAARFLNAALFAASTLLVGLLIFRAAGSVKSAFLGAFLAATSIPLIEIHSAAWSEPLFLFLALAGLSLAASALEKNAWSALVAGALALGGAWLTRYIGGILVAAAVLGLILIGRKPLRRRLAAAACTAVLASLPMGLWLLRNLNAAGKSIDRPLEFAPLSLEHLRSLVLIAGSWLFPGTDRIAFVPHQDFAVAIAVLLALAGFAIAWRMSGARAAPPGPGAPDGGIPALFILSAGLYVAFLLFSIAFFDRRTPIDQRTLSPVFVFLLIAALAVLTRLWRRSGDRRAVRAGLAALAACALLAYGGAALPVCRYLHENGRGFAGRDWRYERIFARLRGIDQGSWIYSNHPAAVFFLTGRQASEIPLPGIEYPPYDPWVLRRFDPGPSLILLFEDARRFAPRDPSAAKMRDREAKARALADRFGVVLERERNAVLYRVERFW